MQPKVGTITHWSKGYSSFGKNNGFDSILVCKKYDDYWLTIFSLSEPIWPQL